MRKSTQIQSKTLSKSMVEKWRPRPIESDTIFDQNRSKMTSTIQQQINAWKVSKNDTKKFEKWAKMASKNNGKSVPKSMPRKGCKNNETSVISATSKSWKYVFSSRKTHTLTKSTFSSEVWNNLKNHQKAMQNSFQKSMKKQHQTDIRKRM